MKEIKIGEPQPLPCAKCKAKEGYQYFDLYRMGYWSFHQSDGTYWGGEYTDGTFCGLVSVILPCRYFALTTNLIGKIIAPNRC